MVLFALAILGLSDPQTTAAPAVAPPPAVYRRPAIAPYEPPSDFGRQQAEGDAVGRPRRARGRPDADGDYQAAVEDRRRAAQALMGPLDGLWRLTDDRGRTVMELALTDPGGGQAVEGAWTLTTARGASRSGPVSSVRRDGPEVRIDLGDDARLRLLDVAGHWVGVLSDGGGEQAVALAPVGLAPVA